ncbi:MAG: tetratricopeptide repeat protein [Casimicrobiaceae bacterium]
MTAPRPDGSINAVRAAFQRGDEDQAMRLCRQALAATPDDARLWTLLGVALRRRDPDAALAALTRATTLDPLHADASFHLGNVLRERANWPEAIAAYRQALVHAPKHPGLLNNLGLALAGNGETVAAEGCYRAVLARVPNHAQALGNLVHLLCARRRFAEALGFAERALASGAVGPDLWIDRGICERELGDGHAAESSFRQALALAPADPTALGNLAAVLIDRGDFEQAEPVLARSIAAAPGDANVLSLLTHTRQHLCEWHELNALQARVRACLAPGGQGTPNPFHLLAMPASPALQQEAARRWAAAVTPESLPGIMATRGDRLRIGYVSSDFRAHAVAFLATEVWERHDRTQVTTFAYALPPPDDSSTRQRIRTAFDTFRDMQAASAADIALQIRRDGIDVLVDMNGYTTHEKSEIFARRPVAVQLQWLGYLGTMGAAWIDGILTDRYVTPPAGAPFFDERLVYLPDCYCPSDTRRPVAPVPGRESCGLPLAGRVYCCFNSSYKILADVFAIWMDLLAADASSVLWLSPASARAMHNLRAEAARRGVAASRLVFAPRVAPEEHLARHAHADLFLDTFPYNAGTAANDALLMGVPVLTCSGDTMASRVAGSQLRAIGLPELVTDDLAAYAAAAHALAADPSQLATLRAKLAANRSRYPLFDMSRFTTALERALIEAAARG